jgi:hypothetical protein
VTARGVLLEFSMPIYYKKQNLSGKFMFKITTLFALASTFSLLWTPTAGAMENSCIALFDLSKQRPSYGDNITHIVEFYGAKEMDINSLLEWIENTSFTEFSSVDSFLLTEKIDFSAWNGTQSSAARVEQARLAVTALALTIKLEDLTALQKSGLVLPRFSSAGVMEAKSEAAKILASRDEKLLLEIYKLEAEQLLKANATWESAIVRYKVLARVIEQARANKLADRQIRLYQHVITSIRDSGLANQYTKDGAIDLALIGQVKKLSWHYPRDTEVFFDRFISLLSSEKYLDVTEKIFATKDGKASLSVALEEAVDLYDMLWIKNHGANDADIRFYMDLKLGTAQSDKTTIWGARKKLPRMSAPQALQYMKINDTPN